MTRSGLADALEVVGGLLTGGLLSAALWWWFRRLIAAGRERVMVVIAAGYAALCVVILLLWAVAFVARGGDGVPAGLTLAIVAGVVAWMAADTARMQRANEKEKEEQDSGRG